MFPVLKHVILILRSTIYQIHRYNRNGSKDPEMQTPNFRITRSTCQFAIGIYVAHRAKIGLGTCEDSAAPDQPAYSIRAA